MYLLNDNGQIDYTLHSGGGPLEIQYLNMLVRISRTPNGLFRSVSIANQRLHDSGYTDSINRALIAATGFDRIS